MFVLSGPSGVGKGSVLKKVCAGIEDIAISVSATTREPREGEKDGRDYHFISESEFKKLIECDGFYEYVETLDSAYGTLRREVDAMLERKTDVILEIETEGGKNIREKRECVSIFVLPPGIGELKRRLETRRTEGPEQLRLRMEKCLRELPCAYDYDYLVINDDVDGCAAKVMGIIEAERQKVSRNVEALDGIIRETRECEKGGGA